MIRRKRVNENKQDQPSFASYLSRTRRVINDLLDSSDFDKLERIAKKIDLALEEGDFETADKIRNNIPLFDDINNLFYVVEDLKKMLDTRYNVYWKNVK